MDAKVIGRRLATLRGNRTQDKVSQDTGISRSAYAMYEQGERIPRDEAKKSLAKYYNTTVQALFFDDE